MTFAQRRNRLTTHFSERIPVITRRKSVFGDKIRCMNSRQEEQTVSYLNSLLVFTGRYMFRLLQKPPSDNSNHAPKYNSIKLYFFRELGSQLYKNCTSIGRNQIKIRIYITVLKYNKFIYYILYYILYIILYIIYYIILYYIIYYNLFQLFSSTSRAKIKFFKINKPRGLRFFR